MLIVTIRETMKHLLLKYPESNIPILLSKTYGTIPNGQLGQFGPKFLFLRLCNKKKHDVKFICTMKTSKKFIVLQTLNKA